MCNRKLLRNVPITQKRSARMRPDACGICLLKQTASGAQSVTSPSKIEGFREFEADLSALFYGRVRGLDDWGKSKLFGSQWKLRKWMI